MGLQAFRTAMATVPAESVVVLEDIDALFNVHRRAFQRPTTRFATMFDARRRDFRLDFLNFQGFGETLISYLMISYLKDLVYIHKRARFKNFDVPPINKLRSHLFNKPS